MEFADGGDLLGKITSYKKTGTRFSEEEMWQMTCEITQAMKQLHDMKVLHRDLKVRAM